jgi:hypothetical protein
MKLEQQAAFEDELRKIAKLKPKKKFKPGPSIKAEALMTPNMKRVYNLIKDRVRLP